MKHINNIPICSNVLFIYQLDVEENLTLKFKEEKFVSTNSGGSLISKDSNVLKKYKDLNKKINEAITTTLEKTLMLENINYKIFSSWLTKAKPKTSSDSHMHSNSWLSGVYYPKGDPGFSIKFFYDNTSPFFTNYLILFFSQLRHKIMPNNSTNNRFSLAFNILPKGQFGEIDSKVIF